MRTLLLGEALVDLVCPEPVGSLAEARQFVPHAGGAPANVAVAAARLGARVALASGVGRDAWGSWLREALAAAGVDLEFFRQVDDVATPVAFVTVDGRGEPSYVLMGRLGALEAALGPGLMEAVEACEALCFTTNTMVGEEERQLTLAARDRALQLDRPVVYDPNLRLGRWANPARATSVAREGVPGAFLVKCNAAEAVAMTGEGDLERAAEALLVMGAQHVVVTRGAQGALLRGEGGVRRDVPGVPAQVRSTVGAGDAVLGVLVAKLGLSGFYPPAVAAALPEAVAAGAAACERWGA